MVPIPKSNLSLLLLLGLFSAQVVVSQQSCRFEGDVQFCENSDGQFVAVSARASSTTAAAPTTSSVASPASITAAPVTSSAASSTVEVAITALTGCHTHDNVQYCTPAPSGTEIAVATQTSSSESLPRTYSDCHNHDGEFYCVNEDGEDVAIHALDEDSHTEEGHDEHEGHGHEEEEGEESHEGHDHEEEAEAQNCHFHAGVEHCTGGTAAQQEATCERPDREYNLNIRIGSLFIVLATSSLAVFGPLILRKIAQGISTTGIRFTIIKQFGTGVIIATAFVHLLTHANLLFASECMGELEYEGTVMAIAMAGAFLTFLIEYFGGRYVMHRRGQRESAASSLREESEIKHQSSDPEIIHAGEGQGHGHVHCIDPTDDNLSVWVMEAGIIFHSILIGITTVVSGDSGFWRLLVVIIFHQMFEGLALGSRIAALTSVSSLSKLLMAGAFACITPIGMGIGIGVLQQFNGSDKATLIALGTLNSLSAGILMWVGFVEMWAGDWIHGYLKRAGVALTTVAMASLLCGMILMGVLGKWA